MKRIIAGILTLCMIFSAESALAFNTSIQETTIASAKPKLSVKADSVVYVGKKTELTATVSGMTGTLRGVTVRWTVNGRSVQTKKSQTIQKGKKLSLSYSIPKTTTSSSVKIAVSVKRGSRTLASKSVRIPVRYGFYGAKLTPSKTTYAIEGKNKTVSMKLTGLKSSLKGTYQWYINGQAQPVRSTTLSKNQTIKLKYQPAQSGTDKIQLVLNSADGKVSMKSPVKILKIYSQYAKTLSSYKTYFTTTDYNRCVNLQNVVKAINGKILQPGEEFSLNQTTGPRNAANGYLESRTYTNGVETVGYGGGSCQVVSTLFNAALLANMAITERHNHSAPVLYVPCGCDAAVSSRSKDFRFQNNLSVPIKIVAVYDATGSITVKLKADYGTTIQKPTIKVTETTGTYRYILRRYVNGKVNYTTYSKN